MGSAFEGKLVACDGLIDFTAGEGTLGPLQVAVAASGSREDADDCQQPVSPPHSWFVKHFLKTLLPILRLTKHLTPRATNTPITPSVIFQTLYVFKITSILGSHDNE